MIDRNPGTLNIDYKHVHIRKYVGESSRSGTVVTGHRIYGLSATGTSTINFQFPIPGNWDTTKNPRVKMAGFVNGTGNPGENYRFEFGAEYKAVGEVIDNIEDETVTWTESAPVTDNTLVVTAEQELDKSLIVGKDHINLIAKRLGGDPIDDRGNAFNVFGVDLIFDRTNLEVAV